MKEAEKKEINNLPTKFKPLGAWAFWGYSILFAIPIIGLIFLIIFSFNGNNICRRSFARSYFCFYVLAAVVILILVLGFGVSFAALFKDIFYS